ncbi:MAG: glycosyltransferase [Actinomycetota bacterium]|nr:glycosyltransferase [Actinomycetota bacterium]
MSGQSVSVVVCVYTADRWKDLVAAVESVRGQTEAALETIVVVDHNEALLARVRHELPDVVAVENGEERGLSGARNSGIAVARGDVVAFLDDDAVAASDWIARLVDDYQDRDVIAVGGAIEPCWLEGAPSWFPEEFNWVVGCSYRGLPDETAPVRNVIGANMSIRRHVFDEIGGFRSGLGRVGTRPVGCEETELCVRARASLVPSTVVYEPRARVRHAVPAARASLRYFVSRCYAEGLSKALVARVAGARDGLASERAYVLSTLPAGVVRGVADTLLGRRPGGLARAAVIVAGLTATTLGYVIGAAHAVEASDPGCPLRSDRDGDARERAAVNA